MLGGRDRCGCSARPGELYEGVHRGDQPRDDQHPARHLGDPPSRTGLGYLPAGDEPWEETDDGARGRHEERRRAGGRR